MLRILMYDINQTNMKNNSKHLALLLAFFLLSACTETEITTQKNPIESVVIEKKSFESLLQTVKQRVLSEKYDTAILGAHEILKKYPNEIQGYLELADIYKIVNNIEKLSALVDSLAKKFPTDPNVIYWQTQSAIEQEDFSAALAIINAMISTEESVISDDVMYYYGILKILQNDFEGGKEVMETLVKSKKISTETRIKAIEILDIYDEFAEFADGENAHFFALIAKNLIDKKEIVLAKKMAENAAKEDVNYIDAWILSGFTKLKLSQYESALVDLNLAYDQDPLRPETHFFLAETLQKLKRHTEAALYYEKALDNGFEFTNSVTRQLIDIFSRQNKTEKVLELYDKLLEAKDAKSEEFVSAVALVIQQKKDPARGLELAQKIQQKFPKDTIAWNLLAWAELENDLIEESQGSLNEAFKLDANNAQTFLNQGFLDEKGTIAIAE